MLVNKVLHVEYPAFAVYRHSVEPAAKYDYVLRDRDILRRIDLPVSGTYQVGSVAGRAIHRNECPIKAYEQAWDRGHETHYIFGRCSVVSSPPEPQIDVIGVAPGDKVLFEGRIFEIVKAPNRNLAFKFVEMAD